MSKIEFTQTVRGQLGFAPFTTPTSLPATFSVYTNRYWIVHPDHGLAWHRRTVKTPYWSPQCNHDERVTTHLRDKLYPGLEIWHIEEAPVREWDDDFGHQPISIVTPFAFVEKGPVRPALLEGT